MVRLAGFQAINDETREKSALQANGETVEAQESRVARTYEHALLLIHRGERAQGQQLLEDILLEPILQRVAQPGGAEVAGVSSSLGHLRFLVLKNLAEAMSTSASNRAMELYSEAALIEPDDVNLWNRLGTLAVKTGRLDVARAAFEAGLQLSPAHRLMQDWLLEVLLALGDLESAEELAVRYLTSCKQHPRMRQVVNACRQLSLLQPDWNTESGNDSNSAKQPFSGQALAAQYTVLKSRLQLRGGAFAGEETAEKDEEAVAHVREVGGTTWGGLLEELTQAGRQPGGSLVFAAPAPTSAGGEGLPEEDSKDSQGEDGAEDPQGILSPSNDADCKNSSDTEHDESMEDLATTQADEAVTREGKEDAAEDGAKTGAKRKARRAAIEPQRKSARRVANENTMDAEMGDEEKSRALLLETLLTLLSEPREGDGSEETTIMQIFDPAMAEVVRSREAEALRCFLDDKLTGGLMSVGRAARHLLAYFATSTGAPLDFKTIGALRGKQLTPTCTNAFLELMDLVGASAWQLIPEEQLLLAECHIDRLASIQQAPEAQTNQQRTAETEAPPPTEGDKKAEEELSPREHHCEQAEDFLAKFGLALMRLGRFGGREEDPERAKEHVALLARYHWASGCLEELQDRPDVAEEHFQACSQLCSPSADDEKGDDAGGSGKRGAPMKIRLAHMQGGADVSAEGVETHLQTIQLRHDLKDAPARIREGADAAGEMAVKLATLLLGEEGNDSAGGTSLSSPDRARRAKLMLPDTSRWLEALEILSGAACVTATATMNSAANQPQQQMQGEERGDGAEVRVQSVAKLVGIQIRSALLRLDELLPATERPPEISHASGKSAGAGALLVVDRRLLRALVDCELIGQQLNDLSSEEVDIAITSESWLHVLQRCLWRAAHLLGRAHSAVLAITPSRSSSHSLSTSMTAARRTLFEVTMGFCGLMEMEPNAREDPETTEKLLQCLFQMLVDAGAVGLDRLRFPNHVIRRLNAASAQRQKMLALEAAERNSAGCNGEHCEGKESGAEEEDDDDEEEEEEVEEDDDATERDDLIRSLRGATFQCLYAMFGVDLPQRDTQWGDRDGQLVPGTGIAAAAAHQQQRSGGGTSLGAKAMGVAEESDASREMWLEVWKCLRALVRGHEKAGTGQSKPVTVAKDVIQRIAKSFPQPPKEVLQPFKLSEYLDGDWPEETGWDTIPPAILNHEPAVSGLSAVEADMYKHLYFQYWKLNPDFKVDEGDMLGEAGWKEVARVETPIAHDLALNPRRFAAWEMLALHYEEALRELLSDVAQWVGVSRWPSAAMVHQPKLAMLQRRTRRAWVAAVHACGTETDRGFTEDNLACSMYREAQSLPPIADQRNKTAERGRTWRRSLEGALAAFRRAESCLSEEWSFPYFQGKILAKFGSPPSEFLPLMARGCHLAKVFGGGLLEPLYRLHASRLKLVLECDSGWTVAGNYCFLPETTEAVGAVDSLGSNHRDLLLNDCLEAMRWILNIDKYFHKAVYRLAKAHVAQGNVPAALEQLKAIFCRSARGRRAFTINMRCIDEFDSNAFQVKRQRRKRQQEEPMDAPEANWGHAPRCVKEPGIKEPSPKMMAAMRKYLVLYINLLAASAGDKEMKRLETVWHFLLNHSTFTVSLDDLGSAALGYYVDLLAKKLTSIAVGLPSALFAEPQEAVAEGPPAEEKSIPIQTAVKPAAEAAKEVVSVSMPSNSAFAWLKSRIGPAPLERPPSPQVVVVAEAAAVQASPPPVESLEEVLVKGRPALSTEVAQWLEQLSGEHCADVERAQRLYTELLVTQGGDAQAVETRLAAVAIAADVQVVWPGLPSQNKGGNDSPHGAQFLELMSEVHLCRLAHCGAPEESRKALEAHHTAVKRRFKSARTAPAAVRRAFGATAAALVAVTFRQVDLLKTKVSQPGAPEVVRTTEEDQSVDTGATADASAVTPKVELKEEALQLLKRCYTGYKTPVAGTSCSPAWALLGERRPRTAEALLRYSFQCYSLTLAREGGKAAVDDGLAGHGGDLPGERAGSGPSPPLSLQSVVEACEDLFCNGARRTGRPPVAASSGAQDTPALAAAEAASTKPGSRKASECRGAEEEVAVQGQRQQLPKSPDCVPSPLSRKDGEADEDGMEGDSDGEGTPIDVPRKDGDEVMAEGEEVKVPMKEECGEASEGQQRDEAP